MNKIGANRLLKLADLLENVVEAKKFDMGCWVFNIKSGCGMAACAGGWAALSPKFRGLVVSGRNQIKCIKTGRVDFAGVEDYFYLSEQDSRHIFGNFSYDSDRPHKKTVANRIRKLVKEQS